MSHELRQTQFVVECTHPLQIGCSDGISFEEFAEGTLKSTSLRGVPFRGRPSLLRSLFRPILGLCAGKDRHRLQNLRSDLRGFWRFLDAFESSSCFDSASCLINELSDLTAHVINSYSQPGPNGAWKPAHRTAAVVLRQLVAMARSQSGLPELPLPPIRAVVPMSKETMPFDDALKVVSHLKKKARAVFLRWVEADQLAANGRNLLGRERCAGNSRFAYPFEVNLSDAHATFRAVVNKLGGKVPAEAEFWRLLGYRNPKPGQPTWWPSQNAQHAGSNGYKSPKVSFLELAGGLYPTVEDVMNFFLLFVARTGWNAATAASLDINDWKVSFDQQHDWIFAPKARSAGLYQQAVSKRSVPTSAGSIVHALINRTLPLREWIRSLPTGVSNRRLALVSPWIGHAQTSQRFFVQGLSNCGHLNSHLKKIVNELGENISDHARVHGFTTSDFRDVAAAALYERSGYSSWMLMQFLGHRSMSSTRRYGYRLAREVESNRLYATAVGDVFSQASVNGSWSSVRTRAKVEGLSISESTWDELSVLGASRTYDGSICSDPTMPPVEIDPENPRDGRTSCIQQHRCAAAKCPRATVLNDSLPWLCRRVAELEYLRQRVGIARFESSSDSSDLESLKATLGQWPLNEVSETTRKWSEMIERGQHQPILFAGSHSKKFDEGLV